VSGKGSIKEGISNEGNRFIVAHNREQPLDSFSQKLQLRKGVLYTFSGKIHLSFEECFDMVSETSESPFSPFSMFRLVSGE